MQKQFYNIFIKVCIGMCLLGIIACGKNEANNIGEIRLNISTYLAGRDQVTHPSVISFEEPWNGYRYWMAYTPYPNANGEEENPSVAVSNDLYKWETPKGMENPIAMNEETGCNELKDSHILYRSDLDRIEIWYLGRLSKNLGGDGTSLMLFRKYTYDGISWSDYETMSDTKYLSPTVYWDGNKYQMWGIGFNTYSTEGTICYQESLDGTVWSEPIKCSIDTQVDGLEIWHGAVTYNQGVYQLVYVKSGSDSQTIEYCESPDGINFDKNKSIIENNSYTNWKRMYRPCLLYEDGNYYCFYGVITESNEWYISMSYGKKIDSLTGIVNKDKEKMIPLNTEVTDTRTIGYKIHTIYDCMRNYLRLELYVLVPFNLVILWLFTKYVGKQYKLLNGISCIVVCNIYTFIRIQPILLGNIIAAILISIIEGISVFCISWYCYDSFKKK